MTISDNRSESLLEDVEESTRTWYETHRDVKYPEYIYISATGELVREESDEDVDDLVNHPKHYTQHHSGVECIQITEYMNFCLGNAIKYIWRADLKHDDDGIEDIEKAIWYLKRELMRREKWKG